MHSSGCGILYEETKYLKSSEQERRKAPGKSPSWAEQQPWKSKCVSAPIKMLERKQEVGGMNQ